MANSIDLAPRLQIFLCSTQLSMKFFLFINVIMPTNNGILAFLSRKNSILGLSEPEKKKTDFFYIFIFMNI